MFPAKYSNAQTALGLFINQASPVRGQFLFGHNGHPFQFLLIGSDHTRKILREKDGLVRRLHKYR